MSGLDPTDQADLRGARQVLEHPTLAVRIAEAAGRPVEALVNALPPGGRRLVSSGTSRALEAALTLALRTLEGSPPGAPRPWLHRGLVVASGAVGGAAGLPGLVLELPVSTTLMFRAIAEHARAQGEDLGQLPARLECLTVFAYGARPGGEALDAGYFAVRAGLTRAVSGAAAYVAERGVAEALGDRAAPALARLLGAVAQRFGAAVSEKAAAQLVPVLGAAGGAAVNAVFLEHYQATARAHFTVRRLERKYGPERVRAAYEDPR